MVNQYTEQELASMEGPRALKELGSEEWCWQTVSALQHMWNSLHLNYEHYMSILSEAEEQSLWEKIPPDEPYGSKEQMLKQVEVGDAKDAQKRMKVQTLASQARALQKHGGDHSGSNGQGDVRHLAKHRTDTRGNSSEYLLGLIKRDHPEVLLRVVAGEFATVRAAAREAGIALPQPKKKVVLSENVDQVADVLKGHYSPEQLQRIVDRLSASDDGVGQLESEPGA